MLEPAAYSRTLLAHAEIPTVDKDLINSFLPELMGFMVEDQMRAVQAGADMPLMELTEVPRSFVEQLEDSELAQKVWFVYSAQ